MAKLKQRLVALAKSLGLQRSLLARAQRRYKANRRRAYIAHNQQEKAQRRADAERAKGNVRAAARLDKEAGRHSRVAHANHLRAQFWLGRTKTLQRRIHKLDTRQEQIQAEIKKLRPKVVGNKVTGGTPKQRWMLACLTSVANCANGKRRNFYSQSGAWDIDHELVGGPVYGHRSDCSSTVTGWAKAAGLPDPNGEDFRGGYTGTLVGQHDGWKQVSLAAMRKKGWGYIVYGEGVGHHTEAFTPSASDPDRTSGHGSSPVDFGTVFLFGPGEYQRYFIWQAPKKG